MEPAPVEEVVTGLVTLTWSMYGLSAPILVAGSSCPQ